MALRKKYHNELVDLRGNIRVFCRVRPVIREDGGGKPAENVVSFDQDDDALVNVLSKGALKTFEMDKVFTPRSTQEEVLYALFTQPTWGTWEWSISNFPCSLTRNITSHSLKNLAFHSFLRWNMIVLTDSHLYFWTGQQCQKRPLLDPQGSFVAAWMFLYYCENSFSKFTPLTLRASNPCGLMTQNHFKRCMWKQGLNWLNLGLGHTSHKRRI